MWRHAPPLPTTHRLRRAISRRPAATPRALFLVDHIVFVCVCVCAYVCVCVCVCHRRARRVGGCRRAGAAAPDGAAPLRGRDAALPEGARDRHDRERLHGARAVRGRRGGRARYVRAEQWAGRGARTIAVCSDRARIVHTSNRPLRARARRPPRRLPRPPPFRILQGSAGWTRCYSARRSVCSKAKTRRASSKAPSRMRMESNSSEDRTTSGPWSSMMARWAVGASCVVRLAVGAMPSVTQLSEADSKAPSSQRRCGAVARNAEPRLF